MFLVELLEMLDQFRAVVDMEEIEPELEHLAEPAGPAALVPEIDDVEGGAATDVGERGVDGLRPGGDHGKGVRKEGGVEGRFEAEGLGVIELLGEAVAQSNA